MGLVINVTASAEPAITDKGEFGPVFASDW